MVQGRKLFRRSDAYKQRDEVPPKSIIVISSNKYLLCVLYITKASWKTRLGCRSRMK